MIGFDLDGTITEKWNTRITWDEMKIIVSDPCKLNDLKNEILITKPQLIPIIYIVIITSRPIILIKPTIDWLRKYKIKIADLSMNSITCSSTEEAAERKAHTINDWNLTKYFEDEEKVRKILTQLCPDTEILTPEDSIQLGFARRYKWK